MSYEELLDEAYVREIGFLGVFGRFAGWYSVASLVGTRRIKKVSGRIAL